jgi:hypothetical protein
MEDKTLGVLSASAVQMIHRSGAEVAEKDKIPTFNWGSIYIMQLMKQDTSGGLERCR